MISIVIVTCNSMPWIARCLESVARTGAEVLVVDNGSQDGSPHEARRWSEVRVLEPGQNLGFAAACNLGARQSQGDALLFLNPDTVLRSSLHPLEAALQRSGVVAVAPRLVDPQGRGQEGFQLRRLPTPATLACEVLLINRMLPNNPVNRRYRYVGSYPEREAEVEQPAGACLMVRRSEFQACGGFDENFYPLWFEDVDLCLRLRQRGGRILYCPSVVFEHRGGHSLQSVNFTKRQIYWYRNLLYYVHKHFGRGTGILIRSAIVAGMGIRIAADLGGLLDSENGPTRKERLQGYWGPVREALWGFHTRWNAGQRLPKVSRRHATGAK